METKRDSRALPTDNVGKIQRAMEHKEEGNAFFSAGLYGKAIAAYGKSLAYTRGLPGSTRGLTAGVGAMANKSVKAEDAVTAEQEATAIEIETAVEANIAICKIKLQKPSDAIIHADKALELNKTYWKAMIRKGEAHMMLRNYDAAREQYTNALRHTNEEKWKTKIQQDLNKIIALEKQEDKKQRKAFAGIFDRANSKEEAPSDSSTPAAVPAPTTPSSSSSSSASANPTSVGSEES